jgi:hypothetical protein
MHHNLEVDFLGKWQILTPWAVRKCSLPQKAAGACASFRETHSCDS